MTAEIEHEQLDIHFLIMEGYDFRVNLHALSLDICDGVLDCNR